MAMMDDPLAHHILPMAGSSKGVRGYSKVTTTMVGAQQGCFRVFEGIMRLLPPLRNKQREVPMTQQLKECTITMLEKDAARKQLHLRAPRRRRRPLRTTALCT